jgi:DNA-binding LytR/AlgR family response regulator
MNTAKILIVEDEVLIAEDLKDHLLSFGLADIYMVHNKKNALQAIDHLRPNLVLLDLRLQLDTDGIDIAHIIDEKMDIPYIFITANADMLLIQKAVHTKAIAYITKPIKKSDLFAAIQMALKTVEIKEEKYLVVKDNYSNLRIPYSDIIYIESNGNYIDIHTKNKKLVCRQTLDWAEEQLPSHQFMRVHRSYIINIRQIERTTARSVFINKAEIPVSRTNLDKMARYLKR